MQIPTDARAGDVAKCLVRNAAGLILVVLRSASHPLYPHHYDFPGGTLEDHETPLQSAERELQEEAGIEVGDAHLTLLYTKEPAYRTTNHYIYGAQLPAATPVVTLSWEHDSYMWLSDEQLLAVRLDDTIDPYFVTVIEYLQTLRSK